MAEKSGCDLPTKMVPKGSFSTISKCADACRGLSPVFLSQRTETCENDLCGCFCVTPGHSDAYPSCFTDPIDNVNLYAYKGKYV